MAVDISMSNRPVNKKLREKPWCCHFLFNCVMPIVCPRFSFNGYGFLPAVWKFEAKIMSTTKVLEFDDIDHAVTAFESDLNPPGECEFFWYLVSNSVLSYLDRIWPLHIFALYPRGLSVPLLAAHIPTNRSFIELLDRRGLDVFIVCTYWLTISAMVNNFVKYLVNKFVFVSLCPKVFLIWHWRIILQRRHHAAQLRIALRIEVEFYWKCQHVCHWCRACAAWP